MAKRTVTCTEVTSKGTDVPTAGTDKGRHLGYTENFYQHHVLKDSTGLFWQIGVINSSQKIQDSEVKTTLKILARKQEILQMRILPVKPDETDPVEFQFQPMDDLEKIDFESVTLRHKDDWPKYISHDHESHKIDHANGPLWRCIFGRVQAHRSSNTALHEYVIFLKLHHGIVDGISGTDFLYKQFLPVLSGVMNGDDAETTFPYIPLTKSVEVLFLSPQKLTNPVPCFNKLALGALRWKNRYLTPPEVQYYKFPDDVIPMEEEPACVPKVFSLEVTDAVIQAAKLHAVTVHCVLLVAGAIALSRTADVAGVQLPRTFNQMWPIDLRKFLDYKTPQPLGAIHSVGVSKVERITDCTIHQFWRHCQILHSSVRQEARQEKCTAFLGMGKYFRDELQKSDFGTLLTELSMKTYIALSNIGNVSAGSAPEIAEGPVKLQMKELFASLSGIKGLSFIPLNQALLTYKGRFMWNVIYYPRKTSRKFVDTYYENLESVINNFCTGYALLRKIKGTSKL